MRTRGPLLTLTALVWLASKIQINQIFIYTHCVLTVVQPVCVCAPLAFAHHRLSLGGKTKLSLPGLSFSTCCQHACRFPIQNSPAVLRSELLNLCSTWSSEGTAQAHISSHIKQVTVALEKPFFKLSLAGQTSYPSLVTEPWAAVGIVRGNKWSNPEV